MRNPCKECIYFHKENNTCQSKKCATGGPGYITVFDKLRAIRGGRRVREATLLLVSALGGGVGMFITMCLVRHKTRKKKFMLGIPLILVLQVAAYVIWRGYFA